MVFYFTSNVVDPPVRLFMGIDKYENEDLIKWGWPEDVWFHVDKVSSAHVYLRLNSNQTIEDIPKELLEDAAQLCKANSISGNKLNNIDVVYTKWSNLRKTATMDVGQVSFHNDKEVYKIRIDKRINEIVNRLTKTKVEVKVDFRAEREKRDDFERQEERKKTKEKMQKDKEEADRRKKEASLRNYENMFDVSKMTSNRDQVEDLEDDFM